ncbi:MAG: RtcB family protein [Candidatus Altiarchaeota archaeon]|nr:RtcB family protein [Candidatus Altiarchaeota archaeon]
MKSDRTLLQAMNVASLPKVLPNVSVMPDGHEGYGFPIGGVAAFPLEGGIVSPGGIGYDINCGIRLLTTTLSFDEVKSKLEQLTNSLFNAVPSGVGVGGSMKLSRDEFFSAVTQGINWAVKQGYATKKDQKRIEEQGFMKTNSDSLSQRAVSRGLSQLGTLGAGNHFLEIQKVGWTNNTLAEKFGLKKDQVVIMIHTGSRGFGHQVASDYIKKILSKQSEYGLKITDRELAAAPLDSKEGKLYIDAMRCAVNFAFNNRQIITYLVRQVFDDFFSDSPQLLYDVAHNIGKFENHGDEVFIHRKGATRAFGPNRSDLPIEYQKTGQPVIIPGSMGTSSYVLAGMGKKESFESTCHGAGRVMSRSFAKRNLSINMINAELKNKGIILKAKHRSLVSEEAPQAYKDVNEVVGVVEAAGISKRVAKLLPLAVIKG